MNSLPTESALPVTVPNNWCLFVGVWLGGTRGATGKAWRAASRWWCKPVILAHVATRIASVDFQLNLCMHASVCVCVRARARAYVCVTTEEAT